MTQETNVKPLWETYPPSYYSKEFQPGKLIARVFLPYSQTLTWANPEEVPDQADLAYLTSDPLFQKGFLDDNPISLDEEGKSMPGNIADEAYWAVVNTLPLQRLLLIRQLSLLNAPNYLSRDVNQGPIRQFPQSRRTHSLLTARIAEHIGLNPIPALVHDLATPPLGDATKSVDPEGLSEETNLKRLLDKYDTSPLIKFGFNKQKTLEVVQGIGPEGQILDIADKIAYTASDVFNFLPNGGDIADGSQFSFEEYRLAQIVLENPLWADVYQEVKLRNDGTPYFQNPSSLGTFLEIRALMHKLLYLNPQFRRTETIYQTAIGNLYSRQPNQLLPFNSDNLLLFTDHEVLNQLAHYWGDLGIDNVWFLWRTPVQFQSSQDKTPDQLLSDQLEQGTLVLCTESVGRFKTGEDFLTVDPTDQTIKPYSEVNPDHCSSLEEIAQSASKNVVYFVQPEYEDKRPKIMTALKLAVQRSIGRNGGRVPHYSLY